MADAVNANPDQNRIIIEGLSTSPTTEWEVQPLADERALLRSKAASKRMLESFEAAGHSNAEVLCDLILGLQMRAWTGVIATEVNGTVRKIFLQDGNLTFATSTLMDDRLGEVIYRNGQITIDQLLTSAALVTREKKFGRVLREAGILDHLGLWRALQMQVRLIVSSVFGGDDIYYEIQSQTRSPIQIATERPAPEFMASCYSFGCLYRHFKQRLLPESRIVMAEHYLQNIDRYPGTFIGDFLNLIRHPLTVADLKKKSKLDEANTLTALMHLYNKKICTISPIADPREDPATQGHYLGLARALTHYHSLLEEIQNAFLNENIDFPGNELRNLCDSLNVHGSQMFFLDSDSRFLSDAIGFMHASCRGVAGREELIAGRVTLLKTFLLQIAGDHLSPTAVKAIRELNNALTHSVP